MRWLMTVLAALGLSGCSAKQTFVQFQALTPDHAPNHFLACPPDFCPAVAVDASAPIFQRSLSELSRDWASIVQQTPRMTAVLIQPEQHYYGYTLRSRWLKFPDSVTVQLIRIDDAHSSLAIFSRSDYGYYDFGVNEKRVRHWLEQLTTMHQHIAS